MDSQAHDQLVGAAWAELHRAEADYYTIPQSDVHFEAVRVRREQAARLLESAVAQRARQPLIDAAAKLREAQKAYMADRGNNEKGQAVARAAEVLDMVLLRGGNE